MPPTSFFDRQLDETTADDEMPEFESVLDETSAILPSRMLTWHYRSDDERLIAFSNANFYNGNLITFPSSWDRNPDLGVFFEHVDGATYGRGGSRANPEEAERVVDLLSREIKKRTNTEVAITAMSLEQATEITSRIEARAATDDGLRSWLDEGNRVKNLETVQGDQCDVMILSFGYGRDASGKLHLTFGPLNRADGYRRLNVAVTRSRKKTIVVASIRAADIPASASAPVLLVREYLDYAERGPIALTANQKAVEGALPESPLEDDVARELIARGWSIHRQVGDGKYRIDIGVRHPRQEGKYVAGIECDGATYHSFQTARDRDVARQEILERRGWTLFRVWSTDWFRHREQVLTEMDRFLRSRL